MLLPLQVAIALLAFVAAACLLLTGRVPAIAGYHLVFAVGILPLILAAMAHFIPVLTRSGGHAARPVRAIPLIATAGGISVLLYFIFPGQWAAGHMLGALISGSAVVVFAAWAWRLRGKTLGTPHASLDWYLAALACLLLGLAAILASGALPGQRAAFRLLHLHLNILGFVGITAFGTLQVLLPTVLQLPDLEADGRMRRHLKWMVAGTLVTAAATAWQPVLAGIGLGLLAFPLLALLKTWWRQYRRPIFALHGPAPLLAAALPGYLLVLAMAAANGVFHLGLQPAAAFIVSFLMPLVTGAVSYLLPLWLKPGRPDAWHDTVRRQMGMGNGVRALLLLAGGAAAGHNLDFGWMLALAAVGTFVIQTLLALRCHPPRNGASHT